MKRIQTISLFLLGMMIATAGVAQQKSGTAAPAKTSEKTAAKPAAKPKSNYKGPVYKIKATVKGLHDTTLLLGHHFGSKKYVVDTIRVDKNGSGVFIGDSLLDGGIYLVILPSLNYFEIMLDKDQEFSFETDTTDLIKNLKFSGSDDNQRFLDYQLFMIKQQTTAGQFRNGLKKHKFVSDSVKKSWNTADAKMHADSAKYYEVEAKKVDSVVEDYWKGLITKYPETILASILKAMKEIDVPESPKDASGKIIDSSFQYKYYKNHYFDNINFGDSRLLRTPILENKIETYLEKTIVQLADSINKEVDYLIDLSRKDEKVHRYVLQYVFNKYQDPKIMGLDGVFVHVSKKYYLSGEAKWALSDTAFINKIKDRVAKMEHNLLGVKAQEMRLTTLNQKAISLHGIDAKYVILYFFDPDCGHCQKIIPEWVKIYNDNKFAEKGIVTLYVDTQVDPKKLGEFADKHGMPKDFVAYDPYMISNFRTNYDIYSTPVPYILDKDKKIVAKRIAPDVIADFLKRMEEIEARKTKK